MTMVSGTITGFAAIISIRASMSSSGACGSREVDMCSAAAQIVRVAMSTAIVRSAGAVIPDSSSTIITAQEGPSDPCPAHSQLSEPAGEGPGNEQFLSRSNTSIRRIRCGN